MWLLIAVGGYIVGVSGMYLLVLRPLFNEVRQVQEESVIADEYLVLQNTASQLAAFKGRVVSRNQPSAVRAVFDSLAVAAGVELVDLSADTTRNEQLDTGFLMKGFQITLEGQYPKIADFLTGVEQPNNYYSVTSLTLVRIDDRTGRARAQLRMRALTVPETTVSRPATSAQSASNPDKKDGG